jgi:hypothetical protein
MKMEINEKRKPYGLVPMLVKATGYSKSYCEKVLKEPKRQKSPGGKIIMEKYKELQRVLSNKPITINS